MPYFGVSPSWPRAPVLGTGNTGGSNPSTPTNTYAACPGGEGAVLKTVGLWLAGSNPVRCARCPDRSMERTLGYEPRNASSTLAWGARYICSFSSAGRASGLHPGGRRFESYREHQQFHSAVRTGDKRTGFGSALTARD